MKNKNALASIIVGVATGALLGILFAPAKGTKTRNKIQSKSREIADKFRSQVNKTVDKAADKYSVLADGPGKFPENGNLKAKEARAGITTSL